MASGDRKLGVTITGDARSAQKAFRDLDKSTSTSAKKSKKSLSTMASGLVGVGAAAAAWKAFDGWNESQKILQQTEAAIRSTGGAAGVTAGEVNDLAVAVSKNTGIHDEAIQTGQNLLLTFTKIRNEAGEGNDIFDQATRIMVDMSAAMGVDAKTSAIQLGKALNDPITGMTALTRSGITFSSAQKAAVREMQESGDIMGAQKLVLAELTTQFEGSAAAQATAMDRAKVSISNMSDELVGVLAPAIEGAADGVGFLTQGVAELPEVSQKVLVAGVAFTVLSGKIKAAGISAGVSQAAMGKFTTSMNKGVGAAAAGAAAFALTTAALDKLTDVSGNMEHLGTDLSNFGAGAITVDEALREADSSADDFAYTLQKLADRDAAGIGGKLGMLAEGAGTGGIALADMEKKVGAVDDALAAMVEAGNTDEAVAAYNRLAGNMIDAGLTAEDIAPRFDTYWQAIERMEDTDGAAAATGNVTNALEEEEQAAKDAAAATDEYAKSVDEAVSALETFLGLKTDSAGSELAFREALLSGTEALQENDLSLSVSTEKGIENRQTIIGMADEVNRLTAAVLDETGSTEAASEAHAVNTLRMQDALIQAGLTEAQVAALTDEYLQVPSDITTAVDVQTELAKLRITEVGTDYEAIKRTLSNPIYLDIIQRYRDIDARAGEGPAPQRRAIGGPVSAGTPYIVGEEGPELIIPSAAGTVIPAGPTAEALGRRRSGGGGGASIGSGGGMTVVVNVAGTVTAEADLAEKLSMTLLKRYRMQSNIGDINPWLGQ